MIRLRHEILGTVAVLSLSAGLALWSFAAAGEQGQLRPSGFLAALEAGGIAPDGLACNSAVDYSLTLEADARKAAEAMIAALEPHLKGTAAALEATRTRVEHEMMAWTLRSFLITGNRNNLGAIVLKDRFWTDAEGRRRPLVVFRSGYTPDAAADGSCFRSLLERGGVKHVINLYEGGWLPVADLDAEERATAARHGASYLRTADAGYGNWRDMLEQNPEPGPAWDEAEAIVARLINAEILRPGGAPPRGNIYLHCGGGMHRSGMIVGILEKAVNHRGPADIARSYRYHVGYRDARRPGGFEQGNLDFIEAFDASLIGD